VLEYLEGGSLRELLDSGRRLSPAQAAEIGAEAARGLAHAHARGMVHRDIKPANLILDEEGSVRVADFGLARALADAAWTEPEGSVSGTARYASPELATGHGLDGRSDVYSLALVLFEAVTGRVPFALDTTVGTLMARVGAELPVARELGPLYPALALGAAPDLSARPDAAHFALELESLVARHGRGARILPASRQMTDGSTRVVPVDAGDEPLDLPTEALPLLPPATAARPKLFDADELLEPDGEEPRAPRDRRGRRAGRRAAALGLLTALLLGGGAFAYLHLFAPRTVPMVIGSDLRSARSRLLAAGLAPGATSSRYGSGAPGSVVAESPRPGSRVARASKVQLVVSLGPAPVEVPVVVGERAALAHRAIRLGHLSPTERLSYSEVVAPGIVISEHPSSGALAPGSVVTLEVSKGPAPRTIPDLSGLTWSDASARLIALRLQPSQTLAYSADVASGTVISTSPPAGTSAVAVGAKVSVEVSEGPQPVAVPSVAGEPIATAVAALRALGLDVTEVVGPPFATTATTTSPGAGAMLQPGAAVTLYAA
jgi:eukaryotic-like serine/threonine-protein kinase